MQQDRIEAFLQSNPQTCHDCGGTLRLACMVVIEKDEIFAVCRMCAIRRDPNDKVVMDDVTEYAQHVAQLVAKQN